MSMLAEPRKKSKWMINPRGMDWVNDDKKFGQKLMEKMGWSKGKGLGREEQGDVDHVSVHLKNNTRGMGYKVTDDQWIQHYEGFESVLAGLNEHNKNGTTSDNNSATKSVDDKNTKLTSLEALSKTSQARVHYHKFTRGKDLSRLNADDIGCITGSKRAKKLAEVKKCDTFEEEAVGQTQHSSGLTTIKGGNIQDYFAKKKAALNLKGQSDVCQDVCDASLNDHEAAEFLQIDSDQLSQHTNKKDKKKGKVHKVKEHQIKEFSDNLVQECEGKTEEENAKKKKKNSDGTRRRDCESEEEPPMKLKKKKKKDREHCEGIQNPSYNEEEPPKKKKKHSVQL